MFNTWIVINDSHIPKHNKKAVNCVLNVVESLQPHGIVLAGDIMNCDTFSRHDINKPPKLHWTDSEFLIHSEFEYSGMTEFLTELNRRNPKSKKIYILGNHEMWLENWIKESPQARRKQFGLRERLPLDGYIIYPHNSFFKLGKLRITHGLYTCQNHARKHVNMMGKSILYGHLHDIETATKVTPETEAHMAWSNGCLCDMNPDYMQNKPHNWSHGFAIVYVYPNGDFQVDIKRIHHGKVIVQGKEYR